MERAAEFHSCIFRLLVHSTVLGEAERTSEIPPLEANMQHGRQCVAAFASCSVFDTPFVHYMSASTNSVIHPELLYPTANINCQYKLHNKSLAEDSTQELKTRISRNTNNVNTTNRIVVTYLSLHALSLLSLVVDL